MPSFTTANGRFAKHSAAFTLVELLMAVTITALIGLAVGSIFYATAQGDAWQKSARNTLVKGQVLNSRLDSTIRSSLEVMQPSDASPVSNNTLVLWAADSNGDSAKQNSEMQLIERDSVTNELRSFIATGDDSSFTNAEEYRTAVLAAQTGSRWATGITALSFTRAGGTASPLISFRFTIEVDGTSHTAIGAASPR